MVSKCIFKLSNELFSQDNARTSIGCCSSHSYSISLTLIKLKNVPLSYMATFVLHQTSEFNCEEIASLLNTLALKVKETIKRAYSYFQ